MTHHHEGQHDHHRPEREHEKREEKLRDEAEMRQPRVIHPAWFLVIGVVLILGVVLAWTIAW